MNNDKNEFKKSKWNNRNINKIFLGHVTNIEYCKYARSIVNRIYTWIIPKVLRNVTNGMYPQWAATGDKRVRIQLNAIANPTSRPPPIMGATIPPTICVTKIP